MKKALTAKELIPWLEKKAAQLEGQIIIGQANTFKKEENYTTAEMLNKMYEEGYRKGYIIGSRDILLEIAEMFNAE